MRESLFRVIHEVKSRPQSKVVLYGHSMGGMVLGKTMGPSLATLLMLNGEAGTRLPVDLIVMANPGIDALTVHQFVDFLKRHGAELQLQEPDGTRRPARDGLVRPFGWRRSPGEPARGSSSGVRSRSSCQTPTTPPWRGSREAAVKSLNAQRPKGKMKVQSVFG